MSLMMVRGSGSGSSSASSDYQDFDCLPPGYRFCPLDPELLFYLNKKVHRQPLPPNNIVQLNLYAHHPQQLAERYRAQGGRDDNEWFFFTQRERRYAKGQRPNRSIEGGHGHWKATGTEKEVVDIDGNVIGYKRSLVFYQGTTHVDGIKTGWLMHEFRLPPPPPTSTPNDTFDDYVLCRVYKKHGGSSSSSGDRDRCRGTKRLRSDESAALTDEEAVPSSNSTSSKIPKFQDRSPDEAEAEASDHDHLQLIAHEINDHSVQNHQQPNIVESPAPRIPSEIHDHVVPRQPPEAAEAADHVFSRNHNQMMMQQSTDFAWEISCWTRPNVFDSDVFAYMSFGDRDGYGDGDGGPSYMRGGGGGCEVNPNYYSNNIHHHDPIAMPSKPSSIGEDLWGDTGDTFVFNAADVQWDDSGRD